MAGAPGWQAALSPPLPNGAAPRQLRPNMSGSTATSSPAAGPSLRIPPRRQSSYATVVPAASPLEHTSGKYFSGGKSSSSHDVHDVPPEEYKTPAHLDLTPLRAHYLKRELVSGQMARELSALADPDALSIIGWPFDVKQPSSANASTTTDAAGATRLRKLDEDGDELDLPFLRFFLHHFVLTFPFLSQVDPKTFYSKKLQPFVESFMARNISLNEEREEETGQSTKRHKLAGKAEKHIGLLISSAVKLTDNQGREEVVRIVDVKSAPPPLPPKDAGSGGDHASASHTAYKSQAIPQPDAFQVNIVGVRTTYTKGRLGRKYAHDEFLVRTSRLNVPDVYVSRRYGDFAKLSEMVNAIVLPMGLC